MNKTIKQLIILAFLVIFGILIFRKYIAEGFISPPTTAQCPPGYKFFNDAKGESFCCSGKLDPYKHTCMSNSTMDSGDICAFKPGMPHPQFPKSILTLCSKLVVRSTESNSESFCPGSLKYYASDGKCCLSGADINGKDCDASDLSDPERYCLTRGSPTKKGEQSCNGLKLFQDVQCPTNLSKVMYNISKSDTDAMPQGTRHTSGAQIPICAGIQQGSCIPDNVLDAHKSANDYFAKSSTGTDSIFNKYKCSDWDRINNKRDLSAVVESGSGFLSTLLSGSKS